MGIGRWWGDRGQAICNRLLIIPRLQIAGPPPATGLVQEGRCQGCYSPGSKERIERESAFLRTGQVVERSDRTGRGAVWGLADGGVIGVRRFAIAF